MVKTNCSTLQKLHTVYSIQRLPRRAAMTRHTHCHAGQQQQPGLAQRYRLPETDGAKFFQESDQVGLYLASIHQMAPPKRGRTHLIIALLLWGDVNQRVNGGTVPNVKYAPDNRHLRVVDVLVDAHHKHGRISRRRRDDDLLAAAVNVQLSLLQRREYSSRLNHVVDADLAPRNLVWLLPVTADRQVWWWWRYEGRQRLN